MQRVYHRWIQMAVDTEHTTFRFNEDKRPETGKLCTFENNKRQLPKSLRKYSGVRKEKKTFVGRVRGGVRRIPRPRFKEFGRARWTSCKRYRGFCYFYFPPPYQNTRLCGSRANGYWNVSRGSDRQKKKKKYPPKTDNTITGRTHKWRWRRVHTTYVYTKRV